MNNLLKVLPGNFQPTVFIFFIMYFDRAGQSQMHFTSV